jgi:hypothetical protein
MIETRSVFYYGIVIDENTKSIPFSEGGPELLAEVKVGSFTPTDFANQVSTALNAVSSNNYVVSFDRVTRSMTISADSNFELLTSSSVLSGSSAYPIMGYTGADKTGGNSYISEEGTGKEYKPQYFLQSYIPLINSQKASGATINVSATGVTEVIQYGKNFFMTCNIKFAVNNSSQACVSSFIDPNINGYDDLIDFMEYCATKGEIEFMENINDRDSFDRVIFESSRTDKNGVGFELKELIREGLKNHYETGIIKFRKV